ncbi:MAG: DUF2147 domain-containing protein [Acidobacteriaceae bacterium]
MTIHKFAAISIMFCTLAASPQNGAHGILGDWREPTGSVIAIFKCGTDICAKTVAISPRAPSQLDIHNPDPKARTHALCGLQIGYGFHQNDPSHADDGKLYDPKSGKTYRGTMTAEGNQLHLRGYVGFKAFGKTETWMRTERPVTPCPR